MILKRCGLLAAFVLSTALGTRAFADTVTLTATMTPSQEVPPTASTASGFATVTVTGDTLTVMESFSGLTVPASAAHIHCCAPPGVSAPVVLPFPGFPAATSGTYTMTFNLLTALNGITEATFLSNLSSGLAYVNIHDQTYPGGEIRGQLTPTPEPGGLILLGTGVAGLAGVIRRKLLA